MKRRKFIQTSLVGLPLVTLAGTSQADFEKRQVTVDVINSGIGGNNSIDLLERIDKDCLSHQPSLTILMVGTNDMNSKKYVPVNDFEKNLRSIVDRILKIKSQLVVMNLLPVYEPYLLTRHKAEFYQPEGHSGRLAQMNDLIERLAKEYTASFLNIHHLFKQIGNVGLDPSSLIKNEANSNVTDGLHPTADGYRVIAVALYEKIIDSKLPVEKIVCFGDSITRGDGVPEGQNYPAYLERLLN